MRFFSIFFSSITITLFSLNCFGQETKISGRVSDPLTNEVIPFASIVFKGTTIGTTSDINGNYELSTTQKADSVIASSIGYIPVTMPVQKGKTQIINFAC